MAEALGVVSGALAVVSLALQLVDAAQQLHTFWQSFGESGSDVERIKDHLATLHAVAATIADICQQEPEIQHAKSVINSLLACKSRTDKLAQLTRNIGVDREVGRWEKSWINLRATVKDKSIRKIEAQLNRDVMMLLLALQPFFHRLNERSLKLITINMTRQCSDLRVDQGTGKFGSWNHHVAKPEESSDLSPSQRSSLATTSTVRRASLSQCKGRSQYFKVDTYQAIESLLTSLGLIIPDQWSQRLRFHHLGVIYNSATHHLYLDGVPTSLQSVRRRFKVHLPAFAFQFQTTSWPRSITCNPIACCQSQIFKLCTEGDIDMVKIWLKNSWTSPFVVNQHGENLLHVAARYAHAELCHLLLDVGVNGAAYDDFLLTPLDHLARRECSLAHRACMSMAYSPQVVNTIRALVERGRCQPLLPVTGRAVPFYSGPKEGFAWLFESEYAGIDLEELDSQGWTILGDSALNFGCWTQLGIDDPAISWQCLYVLRAGANPHATSCKGRLTPLDAYIRGCTAHQVEHAGRWLQILSQSGIDLHKYATEERNLHRHEHFLETSWDEELWRWIPTRRRVAYHFGDTPNQIAIWLEDYDALSWFRNGRFDLDIFLVCTPSESHARWQRINDVDNMVILTEQSVPQPLLSNDLAKVSVLSARWFQLLILSLVLHYSFHIFLVGK